MFTLGMLTLGMGCSSGGSELGSRRAGAGGSDDGLTGFVGAEPPAAGTAGELVPLDAHAVVGIEPAHGPFRGGQLALVRGNGFASNVRVWFGELEIPAEQVTTTRSDRIQVTVPPGNPGAVAVTTQNGEDAATRRTLEGAYTYDPFVVEPATGPTSGGSIITLIGSGTSWDSSTQVTVDGAPCEVVEVRATGIEQELDCRAPAGTEGTKPISVTSSGSVITVSGAYTYEPGVAPTGGLSGAPLAGELTVYVSGGGRPIPGAHVILGDTFDLSTLNDAASSVRVTDADGRAVFAGPFAEPPLVTAAAGCFQPLSFAAVSVDTVRATLSPVASPDCGDAQPPVFGGSPVQPVVINGELVWQGGAEFQRASWTNVPEPRAPGARRAAYVLSPSSDPEARFRLPAESQAVTLDSPGTTGYAFQVVTGAGSRTFYALAGVEDRSVSPTVFTAYAMGVLRGLFANPGETIDGVAIKMDSTLDQALTLELQAPPAGERGPDRLDVRVAVQLPSNGYAILPNVQVEAPSTQTGALDVIGLPALVGDLAGAEYVVGARAVSGATRSLPHSVLPLISARDTTRAVDVTGFLPVPLLSVGSDDAIRWNGELGVSWAAAGRAVDLVLYEVRSGSGLISWTIAAPPAAATLRLPDLSRLPEGGLLPGAIDIVVSLAAIEDFLYTEIEAGELRRFSWDAYASDVASSRHEPAAP